MKIGLLAPYLSQNHGTVLQALALAKCIRELGAECEYIQCGILKKLPRGNRLRDKLYLFFHPKYKQQLIEYKRRRQNDLDYSFLVEPEFKAITAKNKAFVDTYTPVAKMWVNISHLGRLRYDKFVVGSDQTWSPFALYQYSPYYLRQIKDSRKKYSYGCSMGRTSNFSEEFLSFLKQHLSSFSALSCRELSNSKMLEELIGKEVSWVVDPTLLLSRDDWKPYMRQVSMPKNYVVCYILGERTCISEYADELGKRKGLPVYYIMTRPSSCNHKNVLKDVGAAEFLWLIDNCSYLVTDSFHGCVFSINFKKNVMAFNKFEGNELDNARIPDLLSSYNLESHFLTSAGYREPESIDYNQVHSILSERRAYSINYLKKIIH